MELVHSSDANKPADLGILPKPIPFGKYYLLEKINTGGMAEVFKAKAFGVEGFERILAVKRILPSIAEDHEFISMFVDEAKIAGQLTHANVAQIFDLGHVNKQYYIAMEYVPGRDLRAIFDRSVKHSEKLSIDQVCYVIMKLCEGLDYAHNKRDANGHELGIVHRDISPQNVILSYEGECKLIDFGIAKAHGKSSSTQVGILKGKFSYMSPEQVRGGKIDRRSDLFSLGIVLYELLTLQRLFLGSSDFSTLEKIRKVEYSPPTLFNPHIPQELEEIVLKALAKDPNHRFQTAHEMQDALQKFMFNQGLYYTNKDLAAYCKRVFATEISLEQKKLEYYNKLKKEDLERANSNGRAAEAPADLSWDDDESSTAVFDRGAVPQTKDEIYAELDDFQLPEDEGIIYARPKADAGPADVPPPPPPASPERAFEKYRAELPPPRKTVSLEPVPGAKPATPLPMAIPRRQSGRNVGIILAAIVLIALLAVGLVLFIASQGRVDYGTVHFEIDPQTPVSIQIDGETVAKGQIPPLTIEQITAGETHEYRISAEGYGEVTGSFVVDDKPRTIEIKLSKAVTATGGTGISLVTTPANAKVSINGQHIEGASPFQRSNLSPGKHQLEVSLEDYRSERREIDIPENTIVQLQVDLKPAIVALTLQSEPDGADYVIKAKADGKEIKRGKTTDIIRGLAVDASYEVSLSLSGHDPVVQTWTPPQDRLSDTAFIKLPVKVAVAPPVTPTEGASDGQESPPRETRTPRDSSTRDTRPKDTTPKDTTPAETKAPGILRINSKPPASVFINGKDHGQTPKKVELSPGDYTVRLVNKEQGLDVYKQVKVVAGQVHTVVHP